MERKSPQPLEIFYCYARKDHALRDELDIHLAGLHRSGLITTWYDGEIIPGTVWEKDIETHLNTAHIILLLVSPDFIHSDYCYSKEMVRAIERHQAQAARVVPILLRPVDWTDTPFSQLQMLPTGARPVTLWQNQDEAFADIAKHIRRVVIDILMRRNPKSARHYRRYLEDVPSPFGSASISRSKRDESADSLAEKNTQKQLLRQQLRTTAPPDTLFILWVREKWNAMEAHEQQRFFSVLLLILSLLILSALTIFNTVPVLGMIARFFTTFFGWSAYPFSLGLIAFSLAHLIEGIRNQHFIHWQLVVGLVLIWLIVLVESRLIFGPSVAGILGDFCVLPLLGWLPIISHSLVFCSLLVTIGMTLYFIVKQKRGSKA